MHHHVLKKESHKDIVAVSMLWQAHVHRVWPRQLSGRSWKEIRRWTQLQSVEWRFDITAQINQAGSPSQVQKERHNRWRQRRCKSARAYEWDKEYDMLQRVMICPDNACNLQNGSFIILMANGCWQPWHDASVKVSVDRAAQSKGRGFVRCTWSWWFWNARRWRRDSGRNGGREMEWRFKLLFLWLEFEMFVRYQ